jgi:hypothetical protein
LSKQNMRRKNEKGPQSSRALWASKDEAFLPILQQKIASKYPTDNLTFKENQTRFGLVPQTTPSLAYFDASKIRSCMGSRILQLFAFVQIDSFNSTQCVRACSFLIESRTRSISLFSRIFFTEGCFHLS